MNRHLGPPHLQSHTGLTASFGSWPNQTSLLQLGPSVGPSSQLPSRISMCSPALRRRSHCRLVRDTLVFASRLTTCLLARRRPFTPGQPLLVKHRRAPYPKPHPKHSKRLASTTPTKANMLTRASGFQFDLPPAQQAYNQASTKTPPLHPPSSLHTITQFTRTRTDPHSATSSCLPVEMGRLC